MVAMLGSATEFDSTLQATVAGEPGIQLMSTGPHAWLSIALALVATAAAALTLLFPAVLTGPPAMNGSARGTALVTLVLAVPALLAGLGGTARGSVRMSIVWIGAVAYLGYNSVLFLFGTPFNQLFLLYVAMLSLAIWSMLAILAHSRPEDLRRRIRRAMPARAIAVALIAILMLNAIAWLSTIVPALLADRPAERYLAGTGLTTNPVHVQDLAFWIPAMVLSGVWLWQRRAWGFLLGGSTLVFWIIESIGIAVDQWLGARADPSSTVVSMAVVPAFVALACIGAVLLWLFMRGIRSDEGAIAGAYDAS
jgi:hypothetical protein